MTQLVSTKFAKYREHEDDDSLKNDRDIFAVKRAGEGVFVDISYENVATSLLASL